jgi:hypothetical protein
MMGATKPPGTKPPDETAREKNIGQYLCVTVVVWGVGGGKIRRVKVQVQGQVWVLG